MDFWSFFDVVMEHTKHHITLSGRWPYGVFGRDPTEALLQYGAASVVFWIEEDVAVVTLHLHAGKQPSLRVPLTMEAAERLGEQIGLALRDEPQTPSEPYLQF